MKNITINNRTIGKNNGLYFIADIASNHDGDINRAFKLIELAKESGADAAKFQNFKASRLVSKFGFESLRNKMSNQVSWKKSVYDTYNDASIPSDWTQKLKAKCDEVGIEYFTSPYDFESIDLVDPYVNVYKIGSGDITWPEIIEYIAKKGKPVILSTGATNMLEVINAMNILRQYTSNIVLMQCNTNYTNSLENLKFINLNVLKTYEQQFPDVVLGLSDHLQSDLAVLGSIALGARVFEKHFTDDNSRDGQDHKFALNPKAWRDMVNKANELYLTLGDGEKKIELNEQETVITYKRAIRVKTDLPVGSVLSASDLEYLRPMPVDGLPPYKVKEIIGKKIIRPIYQGDYLKKTDFF